MATFAVFFASVRACLLTACLVALFVMYDPMLMMGSKMDPQSHQNGAEMVPTSVKKPLFELGIVFERRFFDFGSKNGCAGHSRPPKATPPLSSFNENPALILRSRS